MIYSPVDLQADVKIYYPRARDNQMRCRPDILEFMITKRDSYGTSGGKLSYLSRSRKMQLARIVRFSPFRHLLSLSVRIIVPRHRTGVLVVGYNDSGHILMLRHVFHPLTPWGLPGGWLEKGESPADCAKRELQEETGLSGKFGPIVYSSFESKPAHIGIAFMAQIDPGAVELSPEIIDAEWFGPASLPEPLLPFVRNAIDAANQHLGHWQMPERGKNE